MIQKSTAVRVAARTTDSNFELIFASDRVGAFILPEYQRKGLGSALSRECDVIADEVGVDTYVSAYESSLKMFESAGFVRLGHIETNLGEYGGPNTAFRTYVLKRDAPATAS